VKYGETMNFSLDKQMERVVEVLALSALLQASTEQIIKNREAVKRLKEIAFPLEIDLDEDNKAQAAVNELVRKYK
jgi:gamma-glutamyl:cysteine ligase YbdK (ATP-grasp superfamily)